jgi:hypothetical protein
VKICAVVFDYPGQTMFSDLVRVLEYSAGKFCPRAKFELVRLRAPNDPGTFTSNTVKMREWLRVLGETGDDVVFMDGDMLILRDIASAFDDDFDVGYTARTQPTKIPMNGGVVFVKNTPAARHFMEMWNAADDKMYANGAFHQQWRTKYSGINQAAFGYMIERAQHGAKLRAFPCREWNACGGTDWCNLSSTRILHVKSDLRRMVIENVSLDRCPVRYHQAVKVWRSMRAEAITPRAASRISEIAREPVADIQQGTRVIVRREAVAFLAKVIGRKMRPSFGLCHGSGTGVEQLWFSQYLGGCEVVGTDVSPEATLRPKTVEWDFSKPNPEWRRCADFIYSNAFTLAQDKHATFLAWTDAVKPGGVIIIEGLADPALYDQVSEWTGHTWKVTSTFGVGDADVSFALIERSKARAPREEQFDGILR